MLFYQFSGYLLPAIIVIDVLLILMLVWGMSAGRKVLLWIISLTAILMFVALGIFKWGFSRPDFMVSSPGEIILENPADGPKSIYYLEADGGVFWKHEVDGNTSESHSLELERADPDSLMIVTHFDDEWYIQPLDLSTSETRTIVLQKAGFDKKDVSKAINSYYWTVLCWNYVSYSLTMIFVAVFLFMLWRRNV